MAVCRWSVFASAVRRYAGHVSIVVALCLGVASCRSLPPKLELSAKDYARAEKDVDALDARAEEALVAERNASIVFEREKGLGRPVSPIAQSRAIDVYYATTRRRSGRKEVSQFFGVDRIRKPASAEYGI